MTTPSDAQAQSEALWREILTQGHRPTKAQQWVFRLLPSAPRCKLCYSPFGGLGGKVVRLFGSGPSRKNPMLCDN